MTESQRAVISRLSHEFEALSRQMSRVSGELSQLDRLISGSTPPHPVAPYWQPYWQPWPPQAPPPQAPPSQAPPSQAPPPPVRTTATPAPPSAPPRVPSPPRKPNTTESGWIGKLLAVAGVAVTLIGVALLLVLAAQAGLLRPEIRVAGGAALSFALVGVAARLRDRLGGRIGAIALAATGIAAAYLDVIALTTIYQWLPAPAGLVLAALIGGAGLTLARRWDSEHLALLVLLPLIALAPVITHGFGLLLVSFMLALSAAALPVQLGKDWTWMLGARVAAAALPLLVALLAIGRHDNAWLLGGACGVAAILAIVSSLILLPSIKNATALAVLTATGTVPVLAAGIAVDRMLAAVLAAGLAAAMLSIVLVGKLPRVVTATWSALSAISALVAVTVAFHGYIEGPVLLALAVIVALAGRHDDIARWAAVGFGVIGVALFLCYAPPHALMRPTVLSTPVAISTLAASLLAVAFALLMARMCVAAAGALVVYAVTAFTVTAGVLVGGPNGGFLAGHMAATVCWIGMAAALFVYALRPNSPAGRTAPITAGLALTAAATAKLFLFDLATLDGIFRVAAFIIVGLVLLGMGAGYARSLAK